MEFMEKHGYYITKIHMCNENGHMKTSTLEELLPDCFGPENL